MSNELGRGHSLGVMYHTVDYKVKVKFPKQLKSKGKKHPKALVMVHSGYARNLEHVHSTCSHMLSNMEGALSVTFTSELVNGIMECSLYDRSGK